MNFKPHYVTFSITAVIVLFISYLLSINVWYKYTHIMHMQGDVASQTLNFANIIILILLSIIISYAVTILIQNFVLKQ